MICLISIKFYLIKATYIIKRISLEMLNAKYFERNYHCSSTFKIFPEQTLMKISYQSMCSQFSPPEVQFFSNKSHLEKKCKKQVTEILQIR